MEGHLSTSRTTLLAVDLGRCRIRLPISTWKDSSFLSKDWFNVQDSALYNRTGRTQHSMILLEDRGHTLPLVLDHADIVCTYDIYIYTYIKNSTAQLTSVGLAHARPNYLAHAVHCGASVSELCSGWCYVGSITAIRTIYCMFAMYICITKRT